MFFKKSKIRNEDRRPQGAVMDLTQIGTGEAARVLQLHGGREMVGKLEAIGIVAGAVIVKKSAILARGPIVLEKGTVQFAIGYGMAKRILVEPVAAKDRVVS